MGWFLSHQASSMFPVVSFGSRRAAAAYLRCSMAAGDPTSALQWLGIALAVSTDSRQLGNEGRLMYLRGRCYQLHLTQTLEEHAMDESGFGDTASASTASASGLADREKFAGRCFPSLGSSVFFLGWLSLSRGG